MLKIVTLTALLAVAAAAPGYFHSAPVPFHEAVHPAAVYAPVPIPVGKQIIPVAEPQDVTYTRTDLISSKITSSVPHPHAIPLVQQPPHSIKNIYYSEENIVREQQAPIHINGPEVEANFRKIEINVPQLPQIQIERQQQQPQARFQQPTITQTPRPLHPQPEEISAPILVPYPQPSDAKPSERRATVNPLPKNVEPSFEPPQLLPQAQPNEVIQKEAPFVPFPNIFAYQTPLASIGAPPSVGYPSSSTKFTDFRRTYFTPITQGVRSSDFGEEPVLSNIRPYVPNFAPCDETPAVVRSKSLSTGVRTQIYHGNGAISTIHY